MMMEPGADGTALHGGAVERYELGGALEGYVFKAGRPISGHLVVEILLADEGPGDGGVALVPGSHKSEVRLSQVPHERTGSLFAALIVRRGCLQLAAPNALKSGEDWSQYVTEVTGKAGSVVLFPECSLVSAWLSVAVCNSIGSLA